jgi:hypothetical protein
MARSKSKATSGMRRKTKPSSRITMTTQNYGIPSRFPSCPGDIVNATFKASFALTTAVGDTSVAQLIVFGKGTSTATYTFADDLFSGFNAMCTAYSRFLVKKITIVARSCNTTTNGGFVAVNYEPTNSTVANPPASLADVSNAVHYTSASAGSPGTIVVRPTDYYNDWRYTAAGTDASSNSLSQMGVSQVIAFGPEQTLLTVLDYEIECCFTGYRA